jgi:hypothetical protein
MINIPRQLEKQLLFKQKNFEGKDIKFYDVYLVKGYLEFVSDKQQDQTIPDEYRFLGRMNISKYKDRLDEEEFRKDFLPILRNLERLI